MTPKTFLEVLAREFIGCIWNSHPVIQPAVTVHLDLADDTGHHLFILLQYLGQWYEAERYFALFEFAGKCVSANYTDMGEGRVNIINRQTSSL
jgi:lipocalin